MKLYACILKGLDVFSLSSTAVVGLLRKIPELGLGLRGAAWASLPEARVSPQVRPELLVVSSPLSPLSCRAARQAVCLCWGGCSAQLDQFENICLKRTISQICESAVNVTLSVSSSSSVSRGNDSTLHGQFKKKKDGNNWVLLMGVCIY